MTPSFQSQTFRRLFVQQWSHHAFLTATTSMTKSATLPNSHVALDVLSVRVPLLSIRLSITLSKQIHEKYSTFNYRW